MFAMFCVDVKAYLVVDHVVVVKHNEMNDLYFNLELVNGHKYTRKSNNR